MAGKHQRDKEKKYNKDWDGWSRLTECGLQMTTFRNVDLDISKWRDRYEKREEEGQRLWKTN